MDALKSAGRAIIRSPSFAKQSWGGSRHKSSGFPEALKYMNGIDIIYGPAESFFLKELLYAELLVTSIVEARILTQLKEEKALKELPENWTDTRETLLEGMLFNLKYLGMTLVEQPKGEEMSAAAVKRIVATAKASGRKLQKVTLKVSPRGIILSDSITNEPIENISIYRISYCTADKVHDKVFAYIAQSQHNENLECHAFLCGKKKMAQAVTLTVAQAFKVAFEFWQASKEEKEKRERAILEGESASSPSSDSSTSPKGLVTTENLVDLENMVKTPLTVNANSVHLDSSVFRPHSSENNNVVWAMDDGLDEAFSRLAQSRTNPQVLDIGLTDQDIQSTEILSPVDWDKVDSTTPGEKDDNFFGF